MNKVNREKVNKYFTYLGLSTDPLYFFLYNTKLYRWEKLEDEKEVKGKTIVELVNYVICTSKICQTYQSTGENSYSYQCNAGANRSSGDIFRLVKKYRPRITIFSVMRAMYKLAMSNTIKTMYCHTINKRVFNNYPTWRNYNLASLDEYGLTFGDWENI